MKHIALRTCLVTRKKLPKEQLARFVVDPESGEFMLDEKGKIRSRGANLSLDVETFDKAVHTGAFSKAFRAKISPSAVEKAREEFIEYIRKVQFRAGRKKVSIRIKGEKVKLD